MKNRKTIFKALGVALAIAAIAYNTSISTAGKRATSLTLAKLSNSQASAGEFSGNAIATNTSSYSYAGFSGSGVLDYNN